MTAPGPPPYTLEQINAMTSPDEQLRARAELKSYIARLKKEKQERLSTQMYTPDTYSTGPYGSHGAPSRGSARGGYPYRGRGHGFYHPYQRTHPPVAAHTFKNRSVTFNKSDAPTESSNSGLTASPNRKLVNNHNQPYNKQPHTEQKSLCPALTSTGLCTRHGCHYVHDPNKQALCKRWLFKDDCLKGNLCSLSHKATSHNAPTCLHFQEGRCNNDICRFAHIRVNPTALNCEAFGRLGYCEKGDSCEELHAHECPTFANTGSCPYGDKCRWGHVHRASRMRQASRPSSADVSVHSSRPSTPEQNLDMIADGEQRVRPTSENNLPPHQFTQQSDYVPLGEED
ncbi:hypothetical protein ACN47E_007637 [Coniothyrium glycines]